MFHPTQTTTRSSRPSYRRALKGQALALIAILMIPITVFAAIAIDLGGREMALRRLEQKAVDVAAWAAAEAFCFNRGNPIDEGKRLARLNGFDDQDPFVKVNITQRQVAGGVEFTADIYASIEATLAKVVGRDRLEGSAQGSATCWNNIYAPDKGTIVAFGSCEGVKVSGSYVNVEGAIWSNTDVSLSNSDGTYGSSYYVNDFNASPGVVVGDTTDLEQPIAMTLPSWSRFIAGGDLYNEAVSAGKYYEYMGSQLIDGGTLPDGLHVFKGDGNVRISNLTGTRFVTFVVLNNIDFHVSANDAVLKPWGSGPFLIVSYADVRNCGVKGVSIASNNVNWGGQIWSRNNISFSDQGNSSVQGAIFAYSVDIQGSNTSFTGQMGEVKLPPYTELVK